MFQAFKEAQKTAQKIPEKVAQTRPGRGPGATQRAARPRPRRGQAAAQRSWRPKFGIWSRTGPKVSETLVKRADEPGKVPDPKEGEIQPGDKEWSRRIKNSRIEDPLM